MRLAVLCDIHGNVPALEAVLTDVREALVDAIVIGGDVLPGPMPRETLDVLLNLDIPTHFIAGNGDLAVLAQIGIDDPREVTYWGTTSGKPLPEHALQQARWNAEQIHPAYDEVIGRWPRTLRLAVDGFGEVLFCHGTPQSETACFTRLTPEEALLPMFEHIGVPVVVCGHTHMQFDRLIGNVRVVNAGSVGMPFGHPGADWLLLDAEIELRHTPYHLQAATERIRQTDFPRADEFAGSILQPPSEEEMLALFTTPQPQ